MSLPPPLVPTEINLSGHEWFPLFPERLRKSRWWRRASDLARARNVMLWCWAWQATPAGSLPDDDDELAEAAGFGMDADAFIAAKTEIMTPWTLCSDGRWYHPTLCEQVLNAWERLDERRKKGRERQARYKARVNTPQAPVTPTAHEVTRHQPEMTRHSGEEERRGEERNDPVGSASPQGGEKAYPEAYLRFWRLAGERMRRRSSREKTFPAWRTASKRVGEAPLEGSLLRYEREDADYARTGGPALHRWLADGRYEHWLPTRLDPADRTPDFWRSALKIYRERGEWGDSSGPKPGMPGCLVPTAILAEFGFVPGVTPLARGAA